jgi:hypothetical protein
MATAAGAKFCGKLEISLSFWFFSCPDEIKYRRFGEKDFYWQHGLSKD